MNTRFTNHDDQAEQIRDNYKTDLDWLEKNEMSKIRQARRPLVPYQILYFLAGYGFVSMVIDAIKIFGLGG